MAVSPLFQRFVDDELSRAPALVARVVTGTVQLLGPSREGPMAGERAHYADLVQTLQRNASLYEKTFVESLRRQVLEELTEVREPGAGEPRAGAGGLELMDESRVDVDIEISRAMQLIDSTAEWELRELQTFTSTLIGQRHVTAESNPFRPLVYATALWDAACTVASAQIQRAIVLRTSAGVLAGLVKNACAAASTRLEAQGVQPGTYRTVVLPSGAGFARAAEPPRPGGLTALLSSMPQAAGERHGAAPVDAVRGAVAPRAIRNDGPSPRSPELEQALQRFGEVLAVDAAEASADVGPRSDKEREALIAAAVDPVDRQVIDLVTRLFAAVAADSQLPAAVRPVIDRLQIGTLRLCLGEAAVLDAYDHAAWRLLDRLGEVSAGYSRPDDPRLTAFLAFAAAVADEIAASPAPDSTVFRRGLNRVEVFLAEQLQVQLRGAQSSVEALQTAERREVFQQHLTHKLTDQMVSVRTSPAIRRFVTGTWALVIAENMLRHGEQSDAALADLKTVDDLLWSLQIPDHPQSRQRLIALLPGLLQRVRVGMETIGLPPAEKQTVLNELMAIHTEALRPGGRSPAGALSPEEIVQRMRDEVVPDAAPARSFSDSVIDLSSMETVPAEHLPSTAHGGDDEAAKRIETLRVGDRQRVFLQGRWSRAQVLWRSDKGLFFLFAGDSPSRPHSITRRALERLNSAGLVQPIEARPLLQRSVDRMMRELSPRS